MENNFSKRLTQLMKQRKISGQKIGEAVGKSQKTISRYANGEIDPPVEMKNKIYKAISDLSGYENLKLLANIQKKISDKEILEALEIVNLTSKKDKKYSKYSLGMKQKLGIAQAIMEKTKFIVLDEPFNGIERETVTRIKDYLKSLKDKGVTIIISSHIKEDLNELVDEMIYFEDGEILSEAN